MILVTIRWKPKDSRRWCKADMKLEDAFKFISKLASRWKQFEVIYKLPEDSGPRVPPL